MNKRVFICAIWACLALPAYADHSAIRAANNQARVHFLLQDQSLNESNTNNYPLYASHGLPYGLQFDLTKTFSRLYTAIALSATDASLTYNDSSLNLSKATSFVQQVNGRAGYSFYPAQSLALTPYLMFGYQHWQLDTGGSALSGYRVNGITQIFESLQAGIGLLGQWEASPRWVLGADLLVFNNYHAWTYATVPLFGDFFYQQATLASQNSWQLAINSDYRLTPKLHLVAGVQYTRANLGSGKTNPFNLTVPGQQSRSWQYSLGLGYALDSVPPLPSTTSSNKASLIAANNQASLSAGLLFQNYGEIEAGQPGYLDRQTGQMPQLTMSLAKTWRNIYGLFAFSEAAGTTQYQGSDVFTHQPLTATISNTMTDLSGRLGYQFMFITNTSITPYATFGYHRWLRAIAYPETYHHNWAGLGALFQWAPWPKLVLSLDGNVGNTFNAQLHTWNTFQKPNTVLFESNLGSRTYLMSGLGADLQLISAWHLLAKINYWRFNYGEGPPVNPEGDHEPTSNTRLLAFSLGLGYGLD